MVSTKLTIPPEPVKTKTQILRNMKSLGSGANWDALALWYGNPVPTYLWQSWGTALKKQGLTWQNFLKKMKYRTEDALHWAKGNMSWDDFTRKVIESL